MVKSWSDDVINLLNYTGPLLPFELWRVVLVVGAAIWVVYILRAWRSGK